MFYAYARVSTDKQTTASQMQTLRATEATVTVKEYCSGTIAAMDRPKFSKLVEKLVTGDTLIVTRLDRLGRNTVDVLTLMQSLKARGVAVRVLQDNINTEGASGEMMLTMLMAVAQFERASIVERVSAGQGATGWKPRGRKPRLTQTQREAARRMAAAGSSVTDVQEHFNVSRGTAHRAMTDGYKTLKASAVRLPTDDK